MTTVSTTPGPTAIGADDKELAPGLDVGEYRLESVLGRGGFGTVYAAVHPVIGKHVAIKVLARRYAADPDIVSRFVAEARAVNQIRHRNIIDIFSFGQLPDGRHYYVMELLEGETLDSYLRDHDHMRLDEALPILRAIARALDAAHGKGIAHRDLKPENIFLAHDPDGGTFPKLLDFGIAKLLVPEDDVRHRTGTGVPIGTPLYMSPEQCRGRDVDHRTDIYSFGIVAYRLLTGAYPFEGDDYMELLYKQMNDEPPPPSSLRSELPPSVDSAIAWMMRKDRDARPQAVLEGVNALDPSASVTPAPPPRTTTNRSARGAMELADTRVSTPNAGRRRLSWIIKAALLVGCVGGALTTYMILREAKHEDVDQPDVPTPGRGAPPPQPVDAAIAIDVAPAKTDRVVITFKGAPENVSVMRDGTRIGVGPKQQLPAGTSEVFLLLEADGYQPLQVSVIPDIDREVLAPMKKKPTAKRRPDKDDTESPFR